MSDLVYRAKTTAQIYKGFSAFGILFIIVGAIFKFVSTKMVKLVRSGVETTTQKLSSGGIVVDIGAHYEKNIRILYFLNFRYHFNHIGYFSYYLIF